MAIRNFAGKVAVITGAGSGIGRALARELAAEGCDLALVDIRRDGMLETRRALRGLDVHVSTHVADVSSEEAMRALPDKVLRAHAKVNLLFNNAGITYAKSFEGHSLDDWKRIVGINLWGVIYGCHFFLPFLREQAGEAHIVNLSSMVAFLGPPEQSSYAATKSAIKGLSESLWAELRGEGIGVTVVYPGAIRTAIMDTALEEAEDKGAFAKTKAMVDRMAMAPDRAARIVLKAVRGNRMRVIVGPDARLFEGAKRAMPEQVHRMFLLPGAR
jgi:short-subunit dehydrogenase